MLGAELAPSLFRSRSNWRMRGSQHIYSPRHSFHCRVKNDEDDTKHKTHTYTKRTTFFAVFHVILLALDLEKFSVFVVRVFFSQSHPILLLFVFFEI